MSNIKVTGSATGSGNAIITAPVISGDITLLLPSSSGTLALTDDIGNGTLTMATTGTGISGSASFTANQSGNATFTVASNATNANTPSTIVSRDALGNFSANSVNLSEVIAGTMSVTGPSTISVNSTSAALRITQTGTGNALLVEDSASTDATPFVIDANGVVVSGNTAPISAFTSPRIQAQVTDATSSFSSIRFSADAGSVRTVYAKSRGALGVNTAVLSGDEIGSLDFAAADGTSYVAAARIFAAVDGTPGTNDMPGRLIFSTTADGASTATEWMRIGSTGAIGFNSSITLGGASGRFRFAGNITGAVSSIGVLYTPTIQSDVTSTAAIFNTSPSTQDAAFTLANLQHYVAAQGTITGGSRTAPTNQVGFQVSSSLTGATNNFGFRSDIAAATGRWNFYAAGTAANYFAGQVQLADGSAAAPALSNFGDENTGIYFPAADTIAFVEGGTEVVRITDAGNVGIGTTAPEAKFDLVGDYKEGPVTANTGTAYTISLASGTLQILTLTGNCTFTFPTAVIGKSFTLLLKQDATGGRSATWPAAVKWPGSTAPTLTATASRLDKFVFTADGTNWYGSNAGQNYTV